MNILSQIIEVGLPYVISILEIMGVLVIALSGVSVFAMFLVNASRRRKYDVQSIFSKSLVTGLELLMAGEIFKTILIQSLDELFILGGLVVIRISLTFLIHFESRSHKTEMDAYKAAETATKAKIEEQTKSEGSEKSDK